MMKELIGGVSQYHTAGKVSMDVESNGKFDITTAKQEYKISLLPDGVFQMIEEWITKSNPTDIKTEIRELKKLLETK